ncbi:MAG: hypothetical protein V9E83_00870 [Baekduia sp.]
MLARTLPPATAAAPDAPSPPPPPNPPAITEAIERFIATAICCVRIVPDAPTIMPATISAVLLRAIPAAAAERPVKAFSSEITTGMSAPPIGNTSNRPKIAASASRPIISHWLSWPATIATPQAIAPPNTSALTGS